MSLLTVGFVFVVLGFPLAMGWVPPNIFYGVRMPTALKSPHRWYAVNQVGGYVALLVGVIVIAVWMF